MFPPIPALCHVVDYYWYASDDRDITRKQYFYTPLLQTLGFNFRQKVESHSVNGNTHTLDKIAYFFGQVTAPREIYTEHHGLEMIGVKFKPTGIARLLGIPMAEITDNIVPVEAIWGNELELLADELYTRVDIRQSIAVLETFLLKKMERANPLNRIDYVERAVSLIHCHKGNIAIKELQSQACITRKTMDRAFMQCLGLMPKLYADITRFNAAKIAMDANPDLSVSDIAFDAGYYDNSHFASAFKRFSGLSPSNYLEIAKAARVEDAYFEDKSIVRSRQISVMVFVPFFLSRIIKLG